MERVGLIVAGVRHVTRDQAAGEVCDRIFPSRWRSLFRPCRRELLANLNGGHFILSDSAEQDLLLALIGIEVPRTVLGDQRDGEGPILSADVEDCAAVWLSDQSVHFLIFLTEPLAVKFVFFFVA